MQALLNEVNSAEELHMYAQRVRAGALGSAQDWQAAEARWLNKRFTTDDLTIFNDEEWPFTPEIATCGVQVYTKFGYTESPETEEEEAEPVFLVEAMLTAFSAMPSTRRRASVAANILFILKEANERQSAVTIPLPILIELATATTRQVYCRSIMDSLDPELDLAEELPALELLGNRLSSVAAHLREASTHNQVYKLAVQLSTLIGTKKIREGILRLVAALAVEGVRVPHPAVALHQLTPLGRVSLVAINLFAPIPVLATHELAVQVLELWLEKEPIHEKYEMQRVVQILLANRPALLSHQISVLGKLYSSASVGTALKIRIAERLLQQLQYRQSGLLNRARKADVAMDWLFDAFEQETK